MHRLIVVFSLFSAISAAAVAQTASSPPPEPKAPGDVVPLGATGTANFSAAWYFDLRTNTVVICRADTTMGGKPPVCIKSKAP